MDSYLDSPNNPIDSLKHLLRVLGLKEVYIWSSYQDSCYTTRVKQKHYLKDSKKIESSLKKEVVYG